jgi:hypothetical protein
MGLVCNQLKNPIDKTLILNRDREVMIHINSYKFISKLFYPTKAKCTIVGLLNRAMFSQQLYFFTKKNPLSYPALI